MTKRLEKRTKVVEQRQNQLNNTSFAEPGFFSLFRTWDNTFASNKHALRSSSEALIGKFRPGKILLNHSAKISICLAAVECCKRIESLFWFSIRMQMQTVDRKKASPFLSTKGLPLTAEFEMLSAA